MTEYIEKRPLLQTIRTLPTWFCDPGAKFFDGPQPPMEALLDPDEVIQTIAGMPSADVPHWIPCSERLPEKDGEYICTMQDGQVQECGFVPTTQNGLIPGWSTCEANGHKFLRYEDVIAWMPLPEPYKEGD